MKSNTALNLETTSTPAAPRPRRPFLRLLREGGITIVKSHVSCLLEKEEDCCNRATD